MHDHTEHDHHQHEDPAEHDHSGGGHEHHHTVEPEAGAELVTCPVMPENMVNPARAEERGLVREYKGTRYWLCCGACGTMWDADPARYAEAR